MGTCHCDVLTIWPLSCIPTNTSAIIKRSTSAPHVEASTAIEAWDEITAPLHTLARQGRSRKRAVQNSAALVVRTSDEALLMLRTTSAPTTGQADREDAEAAEEEGNLSLRQRSQRRANALSRRNSSSEVLLHPASAEAPAPGLDATPSARRSGDGLDLTSPRHSASIQHVPRSFRPDGLAVQRQRAGHGPESTTLDVSRRQDVGHAGHDSEQRVLDDMACVAAKRRVVMQAILRRIQLRELVRSFACWQLDSAHKVRRRQLMRRVIGRMIHRKTSQAFRRFAGLTLFPTRLRRAERCMQTARAQQGREIHTWSLHAMDLCLGTMLSWLKDARTALLEAKDVMAILGGCHSGGGEVGAGAANAGGGSAAVEEQTAQVCEVIDQVMMTQRLLRQCAHAAARAAKAGAAARGARRGMPAAPEHWAVGQRVRVTGMVTPDDGLNGSQATILQLLGGNDSGRAVVRLHGDDLKGLSSRQLLAVVAAAAGGSRPGGGGGAVSRGTGEKLNISLQNLQHVLAPASTAGKAHGPAFGDDHIGQPLGEGGVNFWGTSCFAESSYEASYTRGVMTGVLAQAASPPSDAAEGGSKGTPPSLEERTLYAAAAAALQGLGFSSPAACLYERAGDHHLAASQFALVRQVRPVEWARNRVMHVQQAALELRRGGGTEACRGGDCGSFMVCLWRELRADVAEALGTVEHMTCV